MQGRGPLLAWIWCGLVFIFVYSSRRAGLKTAGLQRLLAWLYGTVTVTYRSTFCTTLAVRSHALSEMRGVLFKKRYHTWLHFVVLVLQLWSWQTVLPAMSFFCSFPIGHSCVWQAAVG